MLTVHDSVLLQVPGHRSDELACEVKQIVGQLHRSIEYRSSWMCTLARMEGRNGFDADLIVQPVQHAPNQGIVMDFSDHAGQAEMLLISDFPLETEHIELIHRLCDKPITPDEIQFSGDRRSCTWPLRLELSYGKIHSGGNNIWHCAMFLVRNREVVSAIHSLGCNLELILKTVELQEPLSLSAGTMKQLAELEINLTIRG